MTLLIFILILSILIIVHEFGHYIVAKKIGVRVERFCMGFGPVLLKKKKGDTEYSVNAIPLGGFVKLAGDNLEEYKGKRYEYYARSPGERFWIIFFGSFLNYIFGILLFFSIFLAGFPGPQVAGLVDGFGAQEAGVEIGDKIIAVDGQRVYFWGQLQNIIYFKKPGDLVNLNIGRDNKEYTIEVEVKEKQFEASNGEKVGISLIGITPETRHGILESFSLGINKARGITLMTYQALWSMITGKRSIREVTGPVGIFKLTSKVAPLGIIRLLDFIGLISISLAIFNLLPFPVLDGGHILFLGLEKIRRKALSISVERIILQVGWTLLLTLFIFITYNDISRFFGDKMGSLFK